MGLAWTEVGGSILTTEAAIMEGRGRLTTTGKLGDVMQESAQAAMSYVRSRAIIWDCRAISTAISTFTCTFRRVRFRRTARRPESPSPPALRSALTSIPVRADLAMTGEITVRGRVLPIGGLKEKLLAAHRQGIFEVVLPHGKRKGSARYPGEHPEGNEAALRHLDGRGVEAGARDGVDMAPLSGMLTAAEIVARSREEKVTH